MNGRRDNVRVRVRVRQSRSTRIIDNAAAVPVPPGRPSTFFPQALHARLLSFRRLDVAGAFTFDTSTTRLTHQRPARPTPVNIINHQLIPRSAVVWYELEQRW